MLTFLPPYPLQQHPCSWKNSIKIIFSIVPCRENNLGWKVPSKGEREELWFNSVEVKNTSNDETINKNWTKNT